MALALFRRGHLPVLGEWFALPLLEHAGSKRIGDAIFDEIFHPWRAGWSRAATGACASAVPRSGRTKWSRLRATMANASSPASKTFRRWHDGVGPPPDPAHQCPDRRSVARSRFPGDLLIAEGVIREAKRGIHAAGVPEGTEVVDCDGRVVAPGLVDMRAFIGEPGAEYRETLAIGEPGGGRRRRHHHRVPARHQSGDRRSGDRRFRPAARARHRDRARAADGGADQGPRRRGAGRDRPAQGGRRGRLHGRRQERRERAGDAPRADLCGRLRRAGRAPHRGPRPGRRRRDERRRISPRGSACSASRAPPRPSCWSATCASSGFPARATTRLPSPARNRSPCCAAPRRPACRSPPRSRSIT